jgi:hypothetical protein
MLESPTPPPLLQDILDHLKNLVLVETGKTLILPLVETEIDPKV